ncbi:MAG: hypothetical protein JO295_09220 [Verrucomicrobia bacterium]|nr:hypothetical protein [Verrucomicrobiota bacterium]
MQQVAAAAASTPAPQQPPGERGPDAQVTETEIVATDGAEFDGRTRQAVFHGQVHIADPRFELWCDQLTVFLNRETKDNEPGDRLPPMDSDSSSNQQSGGIDHAVAEGHVVIRQIKPPTTEGGETKVSIGRSERAEFTNATGEIVLTGGPPSVQQGLNILEATSSRTRIIMTRDNTMRTEGPSRTVIRQRGDDSNKPVTTTNRRNNNNATPAASPGGNNNNKRPRRGSTPAPAPGQQ